MSWRGSVHGNGKSSGRWQRKHTAKWTVMDFVGLSSTLQQRRSTLVNITAHREPDGDSLPTSNRLARTWTSNRKRDGTRLKYFRARWAVRRRFQSDHVGPKCCGAFYVLHDEGEKIGPGDASDRHWELL